MLKVTALTNTQLDVLCGKTSERVQHASPLIWITFNSTVHGRSSTLAFLRHDLFQMVPSQAIYDLFTDAITLSSFKPFLY